MKKRMVMCIIFVGIVFVTGCIGGEKATNTNTSMESQTPNLLIKQSDVPGLGLLDFNFISVPKSSPYNYTSQGSVEEIKN
ncbi:MAG: hypothetical protein O8C61_01465, partial [Candidatus Methanoperedens sp.]|nr:hypothetical protein [Candidatus Methanoperedens sp.]